MLQFEAEAAGGDVVDQSCHVHAGVVSMWELLDPDSSLWSAGISRHADEVTAIAHDLEAWPWRAGLDGERGIDTPRRPLAYLLGPCRVPVVHCQLCAQRLQVFMVSCGGRTGDVNALSSGHLDDEAPDGT